jgi:hypothetical protein
VEVPGKGFDERGLMQAQQVERIMNNMSLAILEAVPPVAAWKSEPCMFDILIKAAPHGRLCITPSSLPMTLFPTLTGQLIAS